jgi:serine/threonine-protein kinase
MAPSPPADPAAHPAPRDGSTPALVSGVPDPLTETFGDRYLLEREIGRGGMATVYLARDLRHQRPVAVKVLHARVAGALDSERFVREIEVAASLSHPLIVPLYDSGEARGTLYYVMPYIEGESLYARLARQRQLPLEEALQITRDVALALGHAHARGVLHRDVKPENILLAGGHALVADFGLARAIGEANYRRLTETGVIVGTVFYLAPEQIREDRDLDQRTDIYSLGCILYEMLTGEPPYTGRSLTQMIKLIIAAPVPSARRLVPAIPQQVDEAIGRALAKTAAERFPTMEAFAAALPARPGESAPEPAVDRAGPQPESPPTGAPTSTGTRSGVLGALRSMFGRGRRE